MEINDIDVSNLSEDEIIDLVLDSIDLLCETLENKNIDPSVIDSALFVMFSSRLEEAGAREDFDEILHEALEEQWEDPPIAILH